MSVNCLPVAGKQPPGGAAAKADLELGDGEQVPQNPAGVSNGVAGIHHAHINPCEQGLWALWHAGLDWPIRVKQFQGECLALFNHPRFEDVRVEELNRLNGEGWEAIQASVVDCEPNDMMCRRNRGQHDTPAEIHLLLD
jgi:hypothetical protein